MKTLIWLLVVVAAIAVVVIVRRGSRSTTGSGAVAHEKMTLEEKLAVLAGCGLKLASPFTTGDLLKSWSREEFDKPGFDIVLVSLGMTEEQEPRRNHCANLWHFDTECIEDDGDYKRIVERMAAMTQGSLPLINIRDRVDVQAKKASFSFSFQGRETTVQCKVQDDWVDAGIFAKFVELLNVADPSKIYIYYDLGGQDCIIGCVSKEDLKRLNAKGIRFVPLT